ncbi:hypothetical protein GCM10028786_07960 [Flaviaesturariibacter terrae]
MVSCAAIVAGCAGVPRSSGQAGKDLQEISYNENAGEGDYSVSLRVRADSTFYQFYNVGTSRAWAGKTSRARWSRIVQLVNVSSVAQLERTATAPGYDGHSASIIISRGGATRQVQLDLLKNGQAVSKDPIVVMMRHAAAYADSLSRH